MARAGGLVLDGGQRLPTVTMDTVSHGRIALPGHFGGVHLIHGAHW
jgi:hypothetical protein